MNPAPGATYYPGFFVRMTYGTEQCNGAAVAGPWTIHLYNNPNIETGEVRYDYHEVIATEVSEDKRNYIWNIPQDQYQKARNVKNKNNYYIRIETESQMGGKLVALGLLHSTLKEIIVRIGLATIIGTGATAAQGAIRLRKHELEPSERAADF
ncbi:hypothetical protein BGZ54_002468, partial [Gamsiella multidivaricata]